MQQQGMKWSVRTNSIFVFDLYHGRSKSIDMFDFYNKTKNSSVYLKLWFIYKYDRPSLISLDVNCSILIG